MVELKTDAKEITGNPALNKTTSQVSFRRISGSAENVLNLNIASCSFMPRLGYISRWCPPKGPHSLAKRDLTVKFNTMKSIKQTTKHRNLLVTFVCID